MSNFNLRKFLVENKLTSNSKLIKEFRQDIDFDEYQNRREEWIYDWVEENGGAPLMDVFEWIYENRRPANRQELVDEFYDYFKLPLFEGNVLGALVVEYLYHFDYV